MATLKNGNIVSVSSQITSSDMALIEKLKQQNQSTITGLAGLQILSGIGAVIYANKKNYSAWGKVGFFFLGTIVTGIIGGLIIRPIIIKRNAKIKELESKGYAV